MAPLFAPKQVMSVGMACTDNVSGSVIVYDCVVVQEFLSETVHEYSPEARFSMVAVAVSLFQMYEYGEVPPETSSEIFPELSPKQARFSMVSETIICVFAVIVVENVLSGGEGDDRG